MKKILCSSLLLSLPISTALAKNTNEVKQLEPLEISVSDSKNSHLTTRLQWTKFPQPEYNKVDLKQKDRSAVIRVEADIKGKITKATVQESTGLKNLDTILINAVKKAEVRPHIENEVYLPTIGFQTFNLKYTENDEPQCDYEFTSKVWNKQESGEKTPFTYVQQPTLSLSGDDLNGHNRSVEFSFKVNKHGEVKSAKIKKGSGVYDLDQSVLAAISTAKVDVPRKLWIYKKSHLKDNIQFKIDECE